MAAPPVDWRQRSTCRSGEQRISCAGNGSCPSASAHDALIKRPIDQIEAIVEQACTIMRDVAKMVTGGFPIDVDRKVYPHGERYLDKAREGDVGTGDEFAGSRGGREPGGGGMTSASRNLGTGCLEDVTICTQIRDNGGNALVLLLLRLVL